MNYDNLTVESIAQYCAEKSGFKINKADLESQIQHLINIEQAKKLTLTVSIWNLKIMMKEVVVYLKQDYSKNESIWVNGDLTKEQITKEVNDKFKEWYYYDIL